MRASLEDDLVHGVDCALGTLLYGRCVLVHVRYVVLNRRRAGSRGDSRENKRTRSITRGGSDRGGEVS